MRNLLALFGFALVAFLGIGWYLDWYKVSTKPGAGTGRGGVEVDINRKKINADVSTGVEAGEKKLHDLIGGDKK